MNPRSFTNPASFKASLEQRLRNMARGSSHEVQRLRQLVVFERLLVRLFLQFQHGVVLKGGLVLELRLQHARTTKDIDLRLVGRPEETLAGLQAAGRLDLGDFLSYEIGPDPVHPNIEAEGMVYEGLRFKVEARLAGKTYGRPFGLDVAFAEPMSGHPEKVRGSNILGFAGLDSGDLLVYPLDAHISEKLHAYTMPRPRPNSRVKDLPDLVLLGKVRALEARAIRAAIDETWSHRRTHPVPAFVPEPSPSWAPVYDEMAHTDQLPWLTIGDLVAAVRGFLDPVLQGGEGLWDPAKWTWHSQE